MKKMTIFLSRMLLVFVLMSSFKGYAAEMSTDLDEVHHLTFEELETKSFEELGKLKDVNETNELISIKKDKIKQEELFVRSFIEELSESEEDDTSIKAILERYSYDDLYKMGYDEQDINDLENYKDYDITEVPDYVLYRLGATCRIRLSESHHIIRNGSTSAGMRATWAWDKSPFFTSSDILAFAWGYDFSTNERNSVVRVDHVNENGLVLATREYDIYDISPNSGCYFKFPISPYLGITEGAAYVHIENTDREVRDFEARVEYGHTTRTGQISVSISGPSISFSSNVERMDYDYIRFRY